MQASRFSTIKKILFLTARLAPLCSSFSLWSQSDSRIILNNSDTLDGKMVENQGSAIKMKAQRAELKLKNLVHRQRAEAKFSEDISYHIVNLKDGTMLKGYIRKLSDGAIQIYRNDYLPDGFYIRKHDIASILVPEHTELATNMGIKISGYITTEKSDSIVVENISSESRQIQIRMSDIARIQPIARIGNNADEKGNVPVHGIQSWNYGRLGISGALKAASGSYANAIPFGSGVLIQYDHGFDDIWSRFFNRLKEDSQRAKRRFLPGIRIELEYAWFKSRNSQLVQYGICAGPLWRFRLGESKVHLATGLLLGAKQENVKRNSDQDSGVSLVASYILGLEYNFQSFDLILAARTGFSYDITTPLITIEGLLGLTYRIAY